MKDIICKRLDALRNEMKTNGIDAAIIPQTDPHQSEYLADHWEARRYLSGFTGSAGTLVVTADKALLWTDSRYFIQAAQQLADTPIILMKDRLPDTPSIEDYLVGTLHKGQTVGFDGMLYSTGAAKAMRKTFEAHGIKLVTDFDVIDNIWPDRPSLPKDKIFVHDEKYAGKSAKSKLAEILADTKKQMADAVFISPLDEIAWTLNIRCNDVEFNPVATSYLYVAPEETILFIDTDKLTPETTEYLSAQGVTAKPYTDVKTFLASISTGVKVLAEESSTSSTIADILGDKAVYGKSPVALPKAAKNDIQIKGIRNAMVRDGVAMVRAFKEAEEILASGERLTELDVNALLRKYRSQQDLFFDESFGTISGYGPHGAIVHYEPDEESNAVIEPHGLLLVDSGAQYLDGTTDITRTLAMGAPTELEKHDFTLVMKGHIALATMVFPKGTYGVQLDCEARKFLWREGLGYLHGTGHGVGHFLNVHEGPHQIRMNYIPATIDLGLVISNEPGLYREGVHGVRCENLVLCVPAMSTEFGDFYKFETLTLYPFDLSLFDTKIMTAEEISWINDYHKKVRESLSPYLNEQEREWLDKKTQQLI